MDIFAFAMLLYELTTGVRPFDEVENVSDINRLVIRGERPRILDYNAEPTFPSLTELMYDCWKQAATDRPAANKVCLGRRGLGREHASGNAVWACGAVVWLKLALEHRSHVWALGLGSSFLLFKL